MANEHIMVSVRFTDALGVPASTSLNGRVDSAVTIGDLITAVDSIVADIHGISDDRILSSDITIVVPQTLAITTGAESNEGITVSMETSAPTRDWGLWIPAVKDSLFGSDGRAIIDSGAIKTFADELVAGSGTGPVVVWETPYLNGYTALESAARFSRKLRGLTSKKSKSQAPV